MDGNLDGNLDGCALQLDRRRRTLQPRPAPLVDCHAHFYPPNFSLQEIHEWSAAAAPTSLLVHQDTASQPCDPAVVLVVPETLADCRTVLDIAASVPGYLPCVGLHPVQPMPLHPVQPMPLPPAQPWPADRHPTASARSATLDDLQPVLDLLADPAVTSRIAAIGECGLDFSPHVLEASLSLSLSRGTGDGQPAAATTAATTAVTGSTSSKKKDPARHDHIKAVQRQIFQAHIDASQRLHIPLNVHSRSAGHHALSQLAASQPHQGALLHAFDGKPSYAVQAAAMQALHDFPSRLMFSVAPIVVRDAGMQAWVKMVPLDALVIETDAPALASVKGARNSVRNASEAVAAVADIKGVDVGTVRQVTTENAARLFPAVRAYLESHHSWTSDTFT